MINTLVEPATTQAYLGSLLHLSDPTLPIGGYTHSNGLETYVQAGIVCDARTARIFTEHMLWYNLRFNDAAFMRFAYEAAGREDLEELLRLDNECTALKCAREIREASRKLGIRLLKIFRRKHQSELVSAFEAGTGRQNGGHYCLVFGIYAQQLGIPIEEALYAFYYNAAVGMVTNSVKLVPLGQLDGQDMLFDIREFLPTLVAETLTLDPELRGLCNIAFDIRCMQHERLYSRLYMS